MGAFHNDVFDNGLSTLTNNSENLYILKADPGLAWSNIALHALGVKAAPVVNSPTDRAEGGREVVLQEIPNGTVTGDGVATHFAITDDSATKILASGPLGNPQQVTTGNIFTLPDMAMGIPDPV